MSDQHFTDLTEQAVKAVEKRDENQAERARQLQHSLQTRLVIGLSAVVFLLFVAISGGLYLQTVYLKHLNAQTNADASRIAALSASVAERADAQAKANAELLCSLQVETHIELQGLRVMARRFGATIPRLPGETKVTCTIGSDPVFIGTSGNDTMVGTSHVDWMNGEGGNDSITAKGSSDTLIGENGNDTLRGGSGDDYLYGGDGNDDLASALSDGVSDHLDGGSGNDRCTARRNDKVVNCETVIRI